MEANVRVERYQANDMREAMSLARTELGKDTVIISSRSIGGKTELIAACDYDPMQLEEALQKFSARESFDNELAKSNSNSNLGNKFNWKMLDDDNDVNVSNEVTLSSIQEELGHLRKLFEGELAQLAWRDAGKQKPNRLGLLSRLEESGISRDIASRLVDKVMPCKDIEAGWSKVLRLLSRVIKISDLNILKDGGVIALLGATGVGKTTTAAKIAARFASIHGANQVGLISADNCRIGGAEQLVSLGSVLGIPVQVANTSEEMQRTLESFSGRKLVIIDTAGKSQRDAGLLEQFAILRQSKRKLHPHLVLSACSQESVINETIKAFSSINLTAAIVTKTDECCSLGAVISELIRNKLPVAFVGNGQKIPEHLLKAKADAFVDTVADSYERFRKLKSNKNLVINQNNKQKKMLVADL